MKDGLAGGGQQSGGQPLAFDIGQHQRLDILRFSCR
jgi:hypothetical protein